MPFLALPKNESLLRFEDGQVTLHYLISTPAHPTFVYAQTHATQLAASLLSVSPRIPLSCTTTTSSTTASAQEPVQLDPRYPLILFLPSECFSVAHLFSAQLADARLSARFNLVAVDPRGHGLTQDVPIAQCGAGRKYDLDIKAADCLDFTRLLLRGEKTWGAGMHLVACSMSGLVAARMAASWPDSFASIMISSPILERESDFMVESFQGIKELLEEAWHTLHDAPSRTFEGQTQSAMLERRSYGSNSMTPNRAKLPGEVVQGFTFRWAGRETIPPHISSYLSRTWLERLILHHQGLQAARDWWFDLYWLRQPMPPSALAAITCALLVVEGDTDLPYDRNVGDEIAQLFPHARSRRVITVEGAPFLLSVTRPDELTRVMCEFLKVGEMPAREKQAVGDAAGLTRKVKERMVLRLDPEEMFELVKVYAPGLVAESDDEDDDDDDDEGSELQKEEEEEDKEEDRVDIGGDSFPMHYRLKLDYDTSSTAASDTTTITARGFPTTRPKRSGSSSS
ncbi:hypothetical protein EX895_004219 [Sporisorium graminicola]|uniref:AB hydrolase-1 domain-containing protein n=1 Tax=Sporisorium graminicola TaxID=280036 RepID=A0A4U7KR72_9BASI|nr:hypothetical protein EX895_004219 [Sporisorium graminicola]TKY86931.1 hypothetical protein EX895_004219 [Sporisorium graminicola]